MKEISPQSLLNQALTAERQGKFAEARDFLRRVVSCGDPVSAQEARLHLGRLLVIGGEEGRDEAEKLLSAARAIAERGGAMHQAARAIHLLALLDRNRRRPEAARVLLEQSPALHLVGPPGPEAGQYAHYLGLISADLGELATAERHLFRAFQYYEEANHKAGLAEVCDSLANLLLKRGKSRRALAFAQRSLELKRSLGDRYGEALSLGAMGRAYLLQARYAESRQAFERDLAIASELNDLPGVSIMLNSLGEVSLLLGEPQQALGYYQRNLSSDKGHRNAIFAELGLAQVHLALDELPAAEAAIARAESLNEGRPDAVFTAAIEGMRGCLAARSADASGRSEGERRLKEAIASLHQQHCDLESVPFHYELRDLLHSQGRTTEAVKVMATALDILREAGSERGVRDIESWLRSVDSPAMTRLALKQYLPNYLVEDLLAGQIVEQQNRRQQISVLFSDIRDYTTLAESLPADDVVDILNEWYSEATRVVQQFGGVVDKFIGDAVMAIFGVPEPRPVAAADAVRTALGLCEALAALNLRNRALGKKEIRIGVGVATGEAVVGLFGSHLKQSYTAVGDVVNTASRLEGATKELGCNIAINQETEEAQQRYAVAETEFLGYVKVKGKQHEVAVYSVLGARVTGAAK